MFIILLKFAANKAEAPQHMDEHNQWLKRGFDDGAFLLAGTITPKAGGAILAAGSSLTDLQSRVDEDPFVAQGVVSAEVLEVSPAKADERLQFLLA